MIKIEISQVLDAQYTIKYKIIKLEIRNKSWFNPTACLRFPVWGLGGGGGPVLETELNL